jgi:hypothetical protein
LLLLSTGERVSTVVLLHLSLVTSKVSKVLRMSTSHEDKRTSLIDFASSIHGEQRRRERDISKRDLQAAVKYGTCEEQEHYNRRTGERLLPRKKFTYQGIVYITEACGTIEVTSWHEIPLPLQAVPVDKKLCKQFIEQEKRLKSGKSKITSHTVLVSVPIPPYN